MSASKIGRFEIVSEVAHSDYSSVYRATDTSTGRPVALKAFNLDLAGADRPDLIQRLLHEAESTRSLTHQNIVLLFGAGEIDGRFCVATEYVEGFSVAANVAKGEKFSVWDMVDISRQVCNGLDHAAEHGVIHKRLHPANILVQWDGTVKILGFGIAGMWSEEDSLGILSPASYYASPEQVCGEALDARSNLFSWGAILYAMATCRGPFDDANADVESVRKQILEGTPVPPIQLNPKLTPALNDLILKALSKKPEDRYQSGRELLDALEGCKEAPKSGGVVAGAPKPPAVAVAQKVAAPTPLKAAAAVASGSQDRSSAESPELGTAPTSRFASPKIQNSAGTAEEEAPCVAPAIAPSTIIPIRVAPVQAPPKVKFDPTMAGEETSGGGGGRSFSEISELPPLTQQYAPSLSPPSEPVAEPEPESVAPSRGASDKTDAGKKKLSLPAMPQVDSKLLIHGLGGGIAVVLLVVACVFLYVRMHTSDDEGSIPPPAPVPTQTSTEAKADATPAAETPTTEAAPVREEPSQPADSVQPAAVASSPKARKGREVATKSAPMAASAQIAVDSSPQGAQIQVDGRADPVWVTPFTLTGLAAGQHMVTVTKSGYSTDARSLSVSSGSKSVLSIHLNSLPGAIAVTSDPAGASVWIDGRDSGRITPTQITLDKGFHNVQVRKAGYLDETTTADGQPGTTLTFGPHLRALGSTDEIRSVNKIKKLWGGNETQSGMGSVAVRTNPKGAQISVNQRVIDHLSPTEFLLNPGNYIVEITASGYQPVRRVISVDKSSKQVVDETLERQ